MDGIWLARPDETGAGEPVAVKDLLDTAGLTTTYGSALFADHVPAVSADAVQLLEAAGFGVAGKTNLHEFAYGISSQNAHYGTVPNPVAPGGWRAGRAGDPLPRSPPETSSSPSGATRGIDPDPGGVVRRCRFQADARARLGRGLLPARTELRRRRSDGVVGGRL